jgi:hypothetical protein
VDQAGSFYGGEYPKGTWGPKGWTLVKAVAKVPADADPQVRLVCYLRRDAVGTAWFDDVSVRLVTGTYSSDLRKSRPPTLQEMRAMSWMCIAAGANGLVYYSFFDLIRAEDVGPFAPRWADITRMAQEIKDLEPMLLSIDPAPQPEPVRDADGAVAWRLYAHEGRTYLVTVNSATEPKTASFGFPKAFSAAGNVMGSRPATRSGSRVELSYEPLEVKIVRLTP